MQVKEQTTFPLSIPSALPYIRSVIQLGANPVYTNEVQTPWRNQPELTRKQADTIIHKVNQWKLCNWRNICRDFEQQRTRNTNFLSIAEHTQNRSVRNYVCRSCYTIRCVLIHGSASVHAGHSRIEKLKMTNDMNSRQWRKKKSN